MSVNELLHDILIGAALAPIFYAIAVLAGGC